MNQPWHPIPSSITLSPQSVVLIRSATSETDANRHEHALTNEERPRMARLRILERRHESIVARGLLRSVLGRLLNTTPQKITFDLGPAGKPSLAGNTRIQFNVSHTRGLVLIAISENVPLGIDAEHIRTDIQARQLAQRYFHPAEVAAIQSHPDLHRAFFQCWTRKEALMKATGRGIALGLNTFSVPVNDLQNPVRVSLPDGHEWTLTPLNAEVEYVAALATPTSLPLQCYSC